MRQLCAAVLVVAAVAVLPGPKVYAQVAAEKPEPARAQPTKTTHADIIRAIIDASLASYPGNCPCPYNRDRAGRSCGRRSAYSRPGGEAPVCYEEDVTPKMVADFKAKAEKSAAAPAPSPARPRR